jgi:hypothetical protein
MPDDFSESYLIWLIKFWDHPKALLPLSILGILGFCSKSETQTVRLSSDEQFLQAILR